MKIHRRSQQKSQAIALRPECLKALAGMQSVAAYEKGSRLFRQGQPAHGVYILQTGRAQIVVEPNGHSELPLRVAGPGYLLGLPSAIRNEPYDLSARLLDDAQVGFIHRDELLPFLQSDCELCFHVVQILGQEVDSAFGVLRAARRGQGLGLRNIA